MNGKRAILVAGVGTSDMNALQNSIGAIETKIQEAFPGYEVRRAFLSEGVIKRLVSRGISVDTPGQALDRLAAEGIREVVVQPAHIIRGEETEKLSRVCGEKAHLFDSLNIAAPLLSEAEDFLAVARILADEYASAPPDTALVFIGHGSRLHTGNAAFATLNNLLKKQGYMHAFVGIIGAYPDAGAMLQTVITAGYKKALLVPLMLTAGSHAKSDLAGDAEGSWKSIFKHAGITVSALLRGLGEYPAIQALYCAHIRNTCNTRIRSSK